MARMIETDTVIKTLKDYECSYPEYMGGFAEKLLNAIKTDLVEDIKELSTVEVVRCKDCRYWVGEYLYQNYGRNYKKCEVTPYLRTEESHFCAMGERRENESD